MTRVKTIRKCRSCGSKKLNQILSLGKQSLSDFTTDNKKPPKYSLTLVLCTVCKLLQLKHTVSQALLYTERYGYKSGINQTMKNELKEIVSKTQKKIKRSKEKVIAVDIGANDGTFLSNYKKNVFKVGIEPIAKLAQECARHADIVINDYFNLGAYISKLNNKKAHIITAISCFYDMEDPNTFLSDTKKMLHQDGILVIQQNYLVGMLKYNAFDNIVHEHLEYYSLLSLEHLLHRHDFEVFDVELSDVNGGSFRTYISHKHRKTIESSVDRIREYEKKLHLDKKLIYQQFAKRVKENKKKIYLLIKKLLKENKNIYVYGASTRGNTLLQYFNLDNSFIKAAIERNPEKWGKKIASVGIPIISENQARKEKPDYMFVLPWFFKDEFLSREKKYLQSGGHFIFPLPKVEVI